MNVGAAFDLPSGWGGAVAVLLCLGIVTAASYQKEADRANPLTVTATLDTARATIGDVLHFQVRVEGAGNRKVRFPDLSVKNPSVAVGHRTEVKGEDSKEWGVDFEVSFWDTGSFTLPSYPVHVLTSRGDTIDYSVQTDSLRVTVATVIDDPNPQLRDLKPPVPIPVWIPLQSISSVVTIAFLMGLLIWLWRKRVPFVKGEGGGTVALASPYDMAKDKMSELRRLDLGASGSVRRFYGDLSHVVREFLESQYFVRALEMTTEEIEKSRMLFPLEETGMNDLLSFLKRADLVKFARLKPGRKACLADLNRMEEFIEESRREWPVSEPNGATTEKIS
ncbi:MAG: hypothetical protein ACE5HZ_08980 [Fidelibacterota bacterium]